MKYTHISEIARFDPALGKDLTAFATRCGGEIITISFDVDHSKPNVFDYMRGKFQEYKPVSRFGGMIEWVKK